MDSQSLYEDGATLPWGFSMNVVELVEAMVSMPD